MPWKTFLLITPCIPGNNTVGLKTILFQTTQGVTSLTCTHCNTMEVGDPQMQMLQQNLEPVHCILESTSHSATLAWDQSWIHGPDSEIDRNNCNSQFNLSSTKISAESGTPRRRSDFCPIHACWLLLLFAATPDGSSPEAAKPELEGLEKLEGILSTNGQPQHRRFSLFSPPPLIQYVCPQHGFSF